jgi:hypothetical protein
MDLNGSIENLFPDHILMHLGVFASWRELALAPNAKLTDSGAQ